ncbi:MAG: hypothetical protein GKC00_02540 [Candidatus Methanofastidiosa archaeon]|nr:hypothetical protein [Candidatus Methanofastidiosa archaeon]
MSALLVGLLLKRKKTLGSKYLALFLTSVFVWSFADFFNLLSTNLSGKLFWDNISYFGVATCGVFLFFFVLDYIGKGNYINRFIFLLLIIPFITLMLIWTNESHLLMRQSIFLENIYGVLVFGKTYGIWFWIQYFYNHCLVIGSTIFIFYALGITHNIYRKQGLIFFLAIFIPWISNLVYVFRIISFPIDMTSLSFLFTGLVLFWGITRQQLLDIIPTAYLAVFNEIPDGVIVLGGVNQILGLNPAAESIFNVKISSIRSKKFSELTTNWKEIKDIFDNPSLDNYYNGVIPKEEKFYGITIKKIYDKKDTFIGQLIVLHDITKRKRMEIKLKESKKQIEDLNETLQITNKILRHDLLNKLTVMKSSLWLFEEKNDKPSLDRLNRSIDSGIELIERARELESFVMTNGKLIPISIMEAAEEVSNNINIPVKINGNAIALADQALFSVFENIYRNAIIHGKTDRIIVDISSQKNICEIRITDYGEGIPEFIKDMVFDEGLSYGTSKGSGLGLYIVKKTIERYGGTISVEDNKPKGAVFIIKLKCPRN